jgi:hypothetical protein
MTRKDSGSGGAASPMRADSNARTRTSGGPQREVARPEANRLVVLAITAGFARSARLSTRNGPPKLTTFDNLTQSPNERQRAYPRAFGAKNAYSRARCPATLFGAFGCALLRRALARAGERFGTGAGGERAA